MRQCRAPYYECDPTPSAYLGSGLVPYLLDLLELLLSHLICIFFCFLVATGLLHHVSAMTTTALADCGSAPHWRSGVHPPMCAADVPTHLLLVLLELLLLLIPVVLDLLLSL